MKWNLTRSPFSGLPAVLLAAGCMSEQPHTRLLPTNPFPAAPVPQVATPNYAPASLEAAARVDTVGRQLLTANPQLGVRPVFRTIGAAPAELFHRGTEEIDITEGLVNQCTTDGQLAGVLACELGKMIAERELLAGPKARAPEVLPPISLPIGNDNAGGMGPPDQTNLAELGKFERQRHRTPAQPPPPPPDPQMLARTYLSRAGYPASDYEAALPLVQVASESGTFARQFQPPPVPARPWTAR